jgi:hypothetical protein
LPALAWLALALAWLALAWLVLALAWLVLGLRVPPWAVWVGSALAIRIRSKWLTWCRR